MANVPTGPTLEVLVADDDPDTRELLGEYFRDRGLSCAAVRDGRAATEALARSGGRFSLILTDIGMPGADGFAVLEAARAANPDAYVVMITGFASLDSAIQAVRAGAHDYLTKPFALGQLDVILERVLSQLDPSQPAGILDRRRGAETLELRLASIDTRLELIEQSLGQLTSAAGLGRRLP